MKVVATSTIELPPETIPAAVASTMTEDTANQPFAVAASQKNKFS